MKGQVMTTLYPTYYVYDVLFVVIMYWRKIKYIWLSNWYHTSWYQSHSLSWALIMPISNFTILIYVFPHYVNQSLFHLHPCVPSLCPLVIFPFLIPTSTIELCNQVSTPFSYLCSLTMLTNFYAIPYHCIHHPILQFVFINIQNLCSILAYLLF